MNKAIIIIAIVLLVIIGGYFLLRGGYQDSTPVSSLTPAPEVNTETIEEKNISDSEVKEFTILGTEYNFSPSSITISAGDQVKIILENNGKISHNFVIKDLGIGTKIIGSGQTDIIEFIAPVSGTYTFICSIPGHAVAGMLGDLIVE